MSANRPENRSRVDVEHLHQPTLVAGNAQLPVRPDLSTTRNLLEPRDGLDDPIRFRRIDLQPRARGDEVAMRGRRGEGEMGDGGVGFEKDGGLNWSVSIRQRGSRSPCTTSRRWTPSSAGSPSTSAAPWAPRDERTPFVIKIDEKAGSRRGCAGEGRCGAGAVIARGELNVAVGGELKLFAAWSVFESLAARSWDREA